MVRSESKHGSSVGLLDQWSGVVMTGQDGSPAGHPEDPKHPKDVDRGSWSRSFDVDLEVAQPARVGDALSDGTAHFTVDRQAVDHITEVLPGGIETGRRIMQAGVAFRHRVVSYLVEVGVGQFLSLGTGISGPDRDHLVAQELAPASRVVYWTSDPVVMAHAHELRSAPEGAVACVQGNLRRPDRILRLAAQTLDLAAPVGVLLRVLASVPDDEAGELVARLMAEVSPGSHLAILHLASDVSVAELKSAAKRLGKLMRQERMQRLRGRSHAQVSQFFDGLDLVAPGVVTVDRWRPDGDAPALPRSMVPPLYGGVGRKP
jgi:hypothetical protein